MDEFDKTMKDLDFTEETKEVVEEIKQLDKKKDDKNTIFTSFLETPEYILEQVKDATDATLATRSIEGGEYNFLIYNKKTGSIDKKASFEYQKKLYKPIVDDISRMGGVMLPTGVTEYKDTNEIVEQLHAFINKNVDLPPFYEKFLPNLALFYWVYESFPFIPYIQFVGRTATGKSTAMEVFGSICYKPINTTGSLTIASVFRVATSWKGTLLIDEFERAGENAREMTSFLKSGVSNNLVLRTEGETKKEVKAYIVKAPKIFTSENPINDAGLQSRTIVIHMEKNKRRIPLFKLPHYYEEAQDIRNKLLLWRFRNKNSVDLSKIEYGFPELSVFESRVQQVISGVFYFADNKTRNDILEFAEEQERENKRERRESLHGGVFEAMYDLINADEIPSIGAIYNKINPKDIKYPVSEKKIANIVRKTLGFDVNREGHSNISVIQMDEAKFNELVDYYGITPSKPSVASVASVADPVKVAEDIFST